MSLTTIDLILGDNPYGAEAYYNENFDNVEIYIEQGCTQFCMHLSADDAVRIVNRVLCVLGSRMKEE